MSKPFDPSKVERYNVTEQDGLYDVTEIAIVGSYVRATDYDVLLALYRELQQKSGGTK